jgi:peptidyl-prolyl cis-trans isomerase B (cyclophilin B)
MRKHTVLSSLVLLGLGIVSPAIAQSTPATTVPGAPAAVPAPQPAVKEVALFKTSKGEMTLEFWSDVAPKTVENFKKLAREGFYNGTAFHRIVKGFMIQGGDPLTKDPANEDRFGTGDPGYKIKAEFNPKKHEKGVISMARSMDPDSAGSQFFICLDAASFLDGKYTTFGRLIKGEDVLVKIGETPVAPNRGGEMSKPTERVVVESVTITPAP